MNSLQQHCVFMQFSDFKSELGYTRQTHNIHRIKVGPYLSETAKNASEEANLVFYILSIPTIG